MKHIVLLLALAGCPSTFGFTGHIYTSKATRLDVLAIKHAGQLTSETMVPVAGAKVECDGCEGEVIVDDRGKFRVGLGTSYRTASPIVMKVSAPGYTPVELEIQRPPHDSQLGYADFVIVLRAETTPPTEEQP
jgi:hypothetical protein